MSLTLKVSRTFLRKKPENKVPDGTTITDGLRENAELFQNLPIKTPDLADVNNRLSVANVAAKTGDKIAAETLKTVNAEWVDKFGTAAVGVSLIANGSKEIILKAGMTPTSGIRRKTTSPERPANAGARPGTGKGSCAISVDAQAGVNGYVGILTPTDAKVTMTGDTVAITFNGTIYLQAGSRRDMQIEGLPSYTAFCATMFTFNSAGSSPLSNSEEMGTQ